MDDLACTYDGGNKLLKVSDTGNSTYGFKDGTNTGDDYGYDANGNLKIDRNKGITSITYNHLNLPEQVNFGAQNIKYVYDAAGSKLKRTSSTGTETLYAGNHIYEGPVGNAQLQFFSHPEGYVAPDGSGGYDYVYNYLDHLGSIRLSYTDTDGNGSIDPTNEIIEENHYYPFGLKMRGFNGNVSSLGNSLAKKFKYQGQELNEGLGYNMYEFELRHYDAVIGRFVTTDIYEQFVSPYVAMGNNPLVSFDPNGGYCYDINGNQIACPTDAGDFYDDYVDSKDNHITILEETGGTAEGRAPFKTDYDYSGESIPGKMQEDLDFIFNGSDLYSLSVPRVPGTTSTPVLDRFMLILARDIEADPEAVDDALTAVTAITPLKVKGVATSSRALVKSAQLPIKGKIRFIPKPSDVKNGRLLKKNGGYVDKFGNVWKKPSGNIIGERHWDVQLSVKGKKQLSHLSNSGNHINVRVNGKIVH